MDFSKLKSGAVEFAVFLTAHLASLGVTVYSFWLLLGADLNSAARAAAESAVARLQDPAVAALLDAYALRPLIPALVVFIAIFLLHVHQQGLRAVGRYTPPELIWYHLPAIRGLYSADWAIMKRRFGGERDYDDVYRLLTRRYDDLFNKRWPNAWKFSSTFEIFKALALLNIVLFIVALVVGRNGLANLSLFLLFATLAAASAAVAVYHRSNQSRWTLREAIEAIAADSSPGPSIELPLSPDDDRRAMREAEDFAARFESIPLVSFGWSLPVIGSISVLRQTWRDSVQRREFNRIRSEHTAKMREGSNSPP